MSVFTASWWKAATMRALRTAAVVAIPYVPLTLDGQNYIVLGSVALTGLILSYITSLSGLPEAGGENRPWYYSLIARVTKTVAQALVTAMGAAVLITDIDWSVIPALVISSAIGSALIFFTQGAPEIEVPSGSGAPVEVVESDTEVLG